jgi:dihydrofolate synthase/folylpolyglutamate synthase
LTTFELLTAVAFVYFKKNDVDFQVLEVGLGGRLDSTNVARGDVCVITSISLDHTQVLGTTIAEIAAEKAGIIKPGSIVVNSPQSKEAQEVIKLTCRQQGAQLIQVGKDVTWRRTGGDLQHQSLTVKGMKMEYDLTIPLIGDYQLENAAAAVAALEALKSLKIKIPREALLQGFNKVNWPGRLQTLSQQPVVVTDGAHNVYSMKKLIEAVKTYFSYNNCIVILGTSCDKDISGMARELISFTPHLIVTSSAHPRAATTPTLVDEFQKQGVKVKVAKDVVQAISQALTMTKKTDLILITGSLFVVAEAISYYSKSKWPFSHLLIRS